MWKSGFGISRAMLATLFANREVTIHKNAISTRIQAGGLSVNYKQILQMLRVLQNRLDSMFNAARILKNPAFSTADLKAKGEGQIVQLLIDFKYKDIPKIINAFVQTLSEANKALGVEENKILYFYEPWIEFLKFKKAIIISFIN